MCEKYNKLKLKEVYNVWRDVKNFGINKIDVF